MSVIPFRGSFDNVTVLDPALRRRLHDSLVNEFADVLMDARAEALDLADGADVITWLSRRCGHKYSAPTIERLAPEAALVAQQRITFDQMARL